MKQSFNKNSGEIRKDMMDEHGYYFCQHCKTNNSLRWETHHIIARSKEPKHSQLHNKKNLIRLCLTCHKKFHQSKLLTQLYIKKRGLRRLFKEEKNKDDNNSPEIPVSSKKNYDDLKFL